MKFQLSVGSLFERISSKLVVCVWYTKCLKNLAVFVFVDPMYRYVWSQCTS